MKRLSLSWKSDFAFGVLFWISCRSVSFFPVKIKVPAKAIFGQIFEFFKCKKWFSRPLFYEILIFFTATFFSLAYFSFFFMGRKNRFHGHKKKYFQFHGEKDWVFSRASISVSQVDFLEIFTGKYSRELFGGFFDFFATTFFVTAIFSVFSTFLQGMISFFKGKNTVVSGRVFWAWKVRKILNFNPWNNPKQTM